MWGNCAFPQNFHTRKLGEITVFFAVGETKIHTQTSQQKPGNHYCWFPNILEPIENVNSWGFFSCYQLCQSKLDRFFLVLPEIHKVGPKFLLFFIYVSWSYFKPKLCEKTWYNGPFLTETFRNSFLNFSDWMHLSLGLAKTVFALAATFDDLLDLSFVLIFFFPRLIFV